MTATFDLSHAISERSDSVQPYRIKVDGHEDFVLAALIPESSVERLASNDFQGFLTAQMSEVDAERWDDLDQDLDVIVLQRLVSAYFVHVGLPALVDENGMPKRGDAVGEALAQNRAQRRSKKR